MPTISNLPSTTKRRAIKIYLDAFRRQGTPCPTCTHHCCTSCASARGYFGSSMPEQEANEHFEKMKAQYGWTDPKDYDYKDWHKKSQGFFVAGQGCRLPYKERSAICIGYTCGDRFSKAQRDAGRTLYSLTKINYA